MTDHDFLAQPNHWRDRAEQTLAKAEQAEEPQVRERLLKIAREYERIAQRAKQSAEIAPELPPWLQAQKRVSGGRPNSAVNLIKVGNHRKG